MLVISSLPLMDVSTALANTTEAGTSEQTATQTTSEGTKLIEIPSLRNETSKVYATPEGNYRAEVSLEPIHYLENNQWVEIDNTLVATEDEQYFENKKNKFKVKFPNKPKNTKKEELFTYSTKGHDITLELYTSPTQDKTNVYSGVAVPETIVKKNQVKYDETYDDVIFDYVVDGSKVKENIILNSYQGKNTFQFKLKATGLNAVKKEDGSIHFVNSKGEFLFLIQRPYMYDSNKEAGPEGVVSQAVTQDIERVQDGFILTLTADEAFLKDPNRVYPVTIDPWIDVFQAQDTYIAKGTSYNYYNNDHMFVGYHSTVGITRALMKWTLPDIPNAEVTGASLGVYQTSANSNTTVNVHKVTSSYDTNTVTWATQPTFSTTVEAANTEDTVGYKYFTVSNLVKGWYDSPSSNYGVMLKYPDTEEGSAGRKSFNSSEFNNWDGTSFGKPKLVIEFRPIELLGITDYWTYTPDVFQGEGTAVVNVINGNMVYDISLLSLSGKTDGFDLDLVYNSRSNYSGAYGLSWMFSGQQTLLANSDQSIIEYRDHKGTRYHFTRQQDDPPGTYSSPEGTYFELTKTTEGYTLKQADETILKFDNYGRNTDIIDEKGNKVRYSFDGTTSRVIKISERYGEATTGRDISLAYTTAGLLDKVTDFKGTETKLSYEQVNGVNRLIGITYGYNRTGNEKKHITFTYYDGTNRLKDVVDAKGNKGTVEYDTSNRVTKIIDPRSTTTTPIYVELTYPTVNETIYKDARGNKTYYKNNWSDNKPTANVVEVKEDYQGPEQAITLYEWDRNNLIKEVEPNQNDGTPVSSPTHTATYDIKGNLETAQSPNNLSETNQYDSKSNVTESTDSSGFIEKNLYDATSNLISTTNSFSLTDFNGYDQYGNETKSTSPTRNNYNRLQNSTFETVGTNNLPSLWGTYSIGQYSLSTTSKHGSRSAKITLSDTEAAGYYTQTIPVEAHEGQKVYTISSQIKAENVTGEGARLRIFPLDANKNSLYDVSGQRISYESAPISGNVDWTRISDTFTMDSRTVYVRVDLLFRGTGTVYFDDAQLVYGTTLTDYHSNENASFEIGNSTDADNWTLNSIGTGDGRTTTNKQGGQYSYRITGTTTDRYVGQYVEVQGKQGDPITVSGWALTTDANTTGTFGLRVWLTYADGTSQQFNIPFMKGDHVQDKWQFVKETIFASKDFTQAKIYGMYGNRSGYVYFDNIKVEEKGSMVTKSYISDGNFLEWETDALNNKTSYGYDTNGNETSVIDPTGKKKTREYDYLDRLKKVSLVASSDSDPNNIVTSYDYDAQGNLETRTDPRGNVTSFTYNEINKVKRETDPLGKFIDYDYDNEGNLKTVKLGKDSNIVSTIGYEYDQKNNEKKKFVGGTELYTKTYFRNSLLKAITMNDGSLYTYTYDTSSRLIEVNEPNGFKLINNYDNNLNSTANGLRTSYQETVGATTQTTSFGYDGLQRLISITGPLGAQTNYYYSEDDQLARIKAGNTVQNQEYDAEGQLEKQSIFAGNDFLQLGYTYYADGNIKTYSDGTNTHTYTYDFAGRLDTWNNGSTTVQYQYDKSGNLKNPHGHSLEFNAANEVIGYDYDDAGNLKKDSNYQYEWDQEGQLLAVKDLNGSLKASFTYHPNGLRKTKTVGSTTYRYHYDDTDLIRVTDQTGKTIWTFTWNNGSPVSLTNTNGESFFYVTNHRGDVIRIVDINGITVASYDYDPWGKLLSSEPSNSKILGQPIRYAGYVYDTETKLYYLQARYYDPDTARFVSKDPDVGDEDDSVTMNGYSYADDNPVMLTDPDGNFAQFLYGGIALYRAYKLYKAYNKVTKTAKKAKKVHGNSKKSKKRQHGYEIYYKQNGKKKVVKVGISGRKLNKNGSSPRANSQVNKWNTEVGYQKYRARVVKKNIANREKALAWERGRSNAVRKAGGNMYRHDRP